MSAKDTTTTSPTVDGIAATVEAKPARRRPASKTAATKKTAAKKTAVAVESTTAVVQDVPALPDVTFSLLVLGRDQQTMTLPGSNATVGDMLTAAELSGKTGETLVNSQRVMYDHELETGDNVVFASAIKGG